MFVYWVRGWKNDDRKSDTHAITIFCGDAGGTDGHHLCALGLAMVARADRTIKGEGS